MTTAYVRIVHFPVTSLEDVPGGLRKLAEKIELGEYGDAHNVAWVLDEGDGVISVGMCGQSPSPGAEAHYLLCLGVRKIEER
jgi:hypothetical protein